MHSRERKGNDKREKNASFYHFDYNYIKKNQLHYLDMDGLPYHCSLGYLNAYCTYLTPRIFTSLSMWVCPKTWTNDLISLTIHELL